MKNKIIAILGPTGTGKTSLAIKLCKEFNGVIVSADSRQVVKHMDVGTGKLPSSLSKKAVCRNKEKWVLSGVDVFGYDLVNPDEYFSAYDFRLYFFDLVGGGSTGDRNVFLVGGTGFYIDAVSGTVTFDGIGPDTELRETLEKLSVEDLSGKLLELDQDAYKKVDKKNPARLIRALEKATAMTTCYKNKPVGGLNNSFVYLGLTGDRDELYKKADKWVDEIFNSKLFEEVKMIREQFPKSHRLKGLVYKSACSYLDGTLSKEEALQRAKFDMHAYIRRQQTYFKKNKDIQWLDILEKNFDAVAQSIVESELNG